MKGFFGIIVIFALIFMCFAPVMYLNLARQIDTEFSALLLSKAADYAGEAAMAACMEVAHIDTDYLGSNRITLSPQRAADTFAAMMCLSQNIPNTVWSIDSIKQEIPVMALAVSDGYYIAEHTQIDDDFPLVWREKQPYFIDTPDAVYAVTLGQSVWYSADKVSLLTDKGTDYSLLPFTREYMLQNINLALNLDISDVLSRYTDEFGGETQGFYLPISANTLGVRRVESPSLIILLNGADLSVVSGMMVTQKRMVVAWTDGSGGKYYCYSGQLDAAAQHWATISGEVFESIEQAARAGYAPDAGVFR